MISIPRTALLDLAATYRLPLFVYDADVITRQVNLLRNSFGPFVPDIHYACKALNTIGIIRHIHEAGCGIDAVSPGEIEMALHAGVPPSKISFTPSGVLLEEYAFALSKGIHIHVDQVHVLHWLAKQYPGTKVTLRFNPGVQAGGHKKLQVGAAGSKFGILADQVDEVRRLTETLDIVVTGVHMHLGSDIGESESFNQAYEYLLNIAMHWRDTIDHVDLGGGFKVPYHPGDHAIDMHAFGANVARRFAQFCEMLGREVALVLEPGKFLVSQAGYLLMEVSGVREAGDTDMIYVQSGFNHFLRPMNYEAYHHIVNLSATDGTQNRYDIVGNLCETDTFALGRQMDVVSPGDILCLCNAGAYGFTMASNYNGRPRPAEVLWKNNEGILIRRAETIADVLKTDVGYRL
jgi:diaminopimelate decarboxylase